VAVAQAVQGDADAQILRQPMYFQRPEYRVLILPLEPQHFAPVHPRADNQSAGDGHFIDGGYLKQLRV